MRREKDSNPRRLGYYSTALSVRPLGMWLLASHHRFLPARRYASAGYCDRNVSVCLSVCLSVRHAPVLCQNEES